MWVFEQDSGFTKVPAGFTRVVANAKDNTNMRKNELGATAEADGPEKYKIKNITKI